MPRAGCAAGWLRPWHSTERMRVLPAHAESYERVRDTLFGDLRAVAERCRALGLDTAAD